MAASTMQLDQPVARFISPVDTAIRADQTVGEALADLRRRTISHATVYFYVVDPDGKLAGVVPTRQLLLSEPSVKVSSVMNSTVVSITSETTLELALELFAMHRLLAIPVTDADGRLLGILDVRLYAEEAADLAEATRQADLFQLIGVRLTELKHNSAVSAFKFRMPWLICNIIGGVMCAVIALAFKVVLEEIVVLAMFIPLVLTLSESVSMQSMTLSLSLVHGGQVTWRKVMERALLEWRTAVMLGLTCGLIVGPASLLWAAGVRTAGIVGFSITLSVIASATFGLMVPTILHGLKLDPRVAAGPVALMATDVFTTAAYLGLATWWLL